MTTKKRPAAKRATGGAKKKTKKKTARPRRRPARATERLFGDRALGILLAVLVGVLIGLVAATWFDGWLGDAPTVAEPVRDAAPREKPAAVAAIPETRLAEYPPAAAPEPIADAAPASPATEHAASVPPAAAWRDHAVGVALLPDRPKIAIVIDDLGLDRPRSARAVTLPGPLTMAYLPYAHDLAAQTAAARAAGHELLVHLPAQPMDAEADPGPNAMMTGMAPDELRRRIAAALDSFDGYVGLNNHMGSRFTADAAGMTVMMAALRDRELVYLDSLTTGGSVGARIAAQAGVPFAVRDVFLDHWDDPIAIRERLAETEAVARRQGFAIAIGHPRDHTLDALEEWLAGIAARGFQLVPVSALIGRARGEG